MTSININRNVADVFYRYKMPRICAKVEGKGNGIKTVLVNMPEIAKSLNRPPTYITKYFGCELGAQTQSDFKNERFIVNGSHAPDKLQDLLDGFIRKFVLCPECDNPETDLVVSTKRNTISLVCKACGYHALLDFNHKLNTHILKNPVGASPSTLGSSLTEGHRSKRSKCSGDHENSENTVELAAKDDKEIPKTSRIKQCKDVKSQPKNDEKWTADVSAEAVRARMLDLTDSAKAIALSEDNEKNEKQRIDLFHAFIKQRVTSGRINGPKESVEILKEAQRLNVKSKAPLILFELLIRPNHIVADVRMHRALFLRFTLSDARAQHSALYAIDAMCAEESALISKIPALLKLLYDEDIVEEKTIIEWAAKTSRKYASREVALEIRQKAEPFIKWLSEADEEDSDKTDEVCEADIELEYSGQVGNVMVGVFEASKQEKGADININAI